MAKFQHLPCSHKKFQKRMKTTKFEERILQQAVKMDGSINFQANGDINVFPCPWEDDKQVTDGARVRYRAGIEVDADGRTRVKRVMDGSRGPKYVTVYETAHGRVMVSRRWKRERPDMQQVIVEFKFPRKYGLALTKALFEEESDEVMAFFKTRKEETVWNR